MRRYEALPSPGHVLPADACRARKREFEVRVRFATEAGTLQTPEGLVQVRPGDAIVTSRDGAQWRVSHVHFEAKYRPLGGERFMSRVIEVRTERQLDAFEVQLSDGVSRLTGHAGDWLVDYGDGSLGVVSAAAFANSYDLI